MRRAAPLLLLLCACVSVPRDAGLSGVETRTGQRFAPSPERISAMLADGLTADEAVAIAMINNPRLQVTLAELGIARADLIEASTIANPLLGIEIRYPAKPYRPFEVTLAQSLIDLVQLPRRRALGRAAFDAAQMRVSSEVLRFAADVRRAYYDLVAETQHAALAHTQFEAAQAAVEVAIKQHGAETITDLQLESEQANYEQAKLEVARAEQRVILARETLIRATGLQTFEVQAFPEIPQSELEQQQLEQLAAQQRLDIAIAKRELEIAQRQIPIARLAVLQQTDADVHYEREPQGQHTVGPGLVVPIPIFNTGRAARTRAEAQFLRARYSLNSIESVAASQVRAARATLAEARARVEYYRDVVVPRRARIVELTKLEHNAMFVGIFQLLQAKQNEMQARRDFIDAQRDYWTARTNLDRALQGVIEP